MRELNDSQHTFPSLLPREHTRPGQHNVGRCKRPSVVCDLITHTRSETTPVRVSRERPRRTWNSWPVGEKTVRAGWRRMWMPKSADVRDGMTAVTPRPPLSYDRDIVSSLWGTGPLWTGFKGRRLRRRTPALVASSSSDRAQKRGEGRGDGGGRGLRALEGGTGRGRACVVNNATVSRKSMDRRRRA